MKTEVPDRWIVTTLGELSFDFFKGINPSKSNSGKFILIPSAAVFPDKIKLEKLHKIDLIIEKDKEKKLVPGDILFNTGGVGTLGRSAYFNLTQQIYFADAFVLVIRNNKNIVYSKLIFYKLNTRPIKNEIEKYTSGTTGITSIKEKDIKTFKISFPESLIEQKKITDILIVVDNTIEKTKEIIEKYKKIKSGLINDLFTTGIAENGKSHTEFKDSDLGIIPQGWDIIELFKVAEILDPHPSHRAPKEVDYGCPFVGIGDIQVDGNILITQCRKISKKDTNRQNLSVPISDYDIGFGRVATVGKVVWLRKFYFEYALSPTLAVIKPKILRHFLFHVLSSNYIKQQIINMSTGSTRTSLGIELLRILKLPIPTDKEEQNRIASVLNSVDNKIQSEQKYLEKLKKLKTGLMDDLLTGKVRVKVENVN